MLLYVHFPFCRSKCRYCAFYSESIPQNEGDVVSLWKDTLLSSLHQWADRLGHPKVKTVYFGGGTPSLAPPGLLGEILDAIAANFVLESEAEISMEANPESMTPEKAADFMLAGVNRVSLGVQALDDALLNVLGRVHNKAAALRAYEGLRRAGFRNVGLDFIWGLPGESLECWRRQLNEAAILEPDHLSCYGLTLEPGTPFFGERQGVELPDDDVQAAMYLACGEILEAAGYWQYEVSNYALLGHACRHNLGYWRGEDYLGLGPSAVSTVYGGRRVEPSSLPGWREAVRLGHFNTESLSFAEKVEEFLMLSLRTAEGLDEGRYRAVTGRDLAKEHAGFLSELVAAGLALREGGRLRLTRRGMLLSNSIIERFFETVPESPCLP